MGRFAPLLLGAGPPLAELPVFKPFSYLTAYNNDYLLITVFEDENGFCYDVYSGYSYCFGYRTDFYLILLLGSY